MANEFKVDWQTADACDNTNLTGGIAGGDVWASDKITNGDPACDLMRISYDLSFDANVVAGDVVLFYMFPIAVSGGLKPNTLDAGSTDQEETATPDELAAAGILFHSHILVGAGAHQITGVSDSVKCDAPEFCVGFMLQSTAGAVNSDASSSNTNAVNVHRGVYQYQSS